MNTEQTNIKNPFNIQISDQDKPILKILGQDPNNIWFSNRYIYQDTPFTVKIKQKLIGLLSTLETYLNHAPKHEKYALCDRIRNRSLDIVESLSECICCPSKSRSSYVLKLSYKLNTLQCLIEVFRVKGYFRCKCGRINAFTEVEGIRRAFVVESQLAEIGNMIGGWIKYIKTQQTTHNTNSTLIPNSKHDVLSVLSTNW